MIRSSIVTALAAVFVTSFMPSPTGAEATPGQSRIKYNFKAAEKRSSYKGKRIVAYDGDQVPGTIVVDTARRKLTYVLAGGQAIEYGVGVGRQGFTWSGTATVDRKAKWPAWYPPAGMRKREPHLPRMMPGGPRNPLGARALYLFENGRDTLYRIHGTNEADTIGRAVSSGCIRMLNEEVIDLYQRVKLGARVIVL